MEIGKIILRNFKEMKKMWKIIFTKIGKMSKIIFMEFHANGKNAEKYYAEKYFTEKIFYGKWEKILQNN